MPSSSKIVSPQAPQVSTEYARMCYPSIVEKLLRTLTAQAQQADALHTQSRELLVDAVRTGAINGLTQRQIAVAIGRSQPEVSRLLRFQGTTPRGRTLVMHQGSVVRTIRSYGGRNPRVFGSVAAGTDGEHSDKDLLVDFDTSSSLLTLARLERDLQTLLATPVDIVTPSTLRANLRARVLRTAIPL